LLAFWRDDVELVSAGAERVDELMEESAVDAVVVGDEKTIAESCRR
jgi:hypothetical protein